MHAGVLRHALLTSLCVCATVIGDVLEMKSVSGSDSILLCDIRSKPGVRYRAVRWFKVGETPSPLLSGLLTRNLNNGTTRWYAGVERDVRLLDGSRDLLLTNVTCGDSGLYSCQLAAPLGEQNLEGRIRLTVTDCADDPDTYIIIGAVAMLMVALVIFLISYINLKKTLRSKNKTPIVETLLNAPLKPLEKKDLMLIYTLGPKWCKTPTLKHICV
ncbi:CD83 antigen [Antennarius striatus]|uniref:CD83 antigen n=1 Tax=Antennarius striatus TaxID=241820 RepID=UPI0035B332FB